MSYFVTITKRDKKILTEEGPFDHIDPAIHYLLENNYFLAVLTNYSILQYR